MPVLRVRQERRAAVVGHTHRLAAGRPRAARERASPNTPAPQPASPRLALAPRSRQPLRSTTRGGRASTGRRAWHWVYIPGRNPRFGGVWGGRHARPPRTWLRLPPPRRRRRFDQDERHLLWGVAHHRDARGRTRPGAAGLHTRTHARAHAEPPADTTPQHPWRAGGRRQHLHSAVGALLPVAGGPQAGSQRSHTSSDQARAGWLAGWLASWGPVPPGERRC
jgi:hypothetical protein